MSRWGRSAVHYRGRKVDIRSGDTDVSKIEKMLKEDYKDIMHEHYKELLDVSEQIQSDAGYLAPFETGALEESIMVRPYLPQAGPGMIAHASAHDRGFDYAVVQEENEEYDHDYSVEGKEREKEFASAHYLGGSFALGISEWYTEVTDGDELVLSPELEHAMNYVKHLIR